jgi:hypothetical protein
MSIVKKNAVQTADEAISVIRATRDQLSRLTALMNAIHTDALNGEAINIEPLSYLGAELGLELGRSLDHQIEILQTHLDAAGGEV